MSIAETLLVYVGVPLALVAVMALLTLRPAPHERRTRYRPGQPWEHTPVWYAPHPENVSVPGDGQTLALEAGAHRPVAGPLGGARGTW